MEERDICRMNRTLGEHKVLLETLQKEVLTCRQEMGALRDSLTSTGMLDQDHFLGKLHLRRFADVKKRYRLDIDASLDRLVDIHTVALSIGQSAGHMTVRRLREASKATNVAAGQILGSLSSGQIYLCGGRRGANELRSIERFDPSSQAWEVVPPLMVPREWACAAVVEGRIYVCGGWGDVPLRSVERFHPSAGTWEAMPPLSVARWGAAAAVVTGKLHICGGLDVVGVSTSSVERLELVGGSGESPVWDPVPAMSHPRGWPVAGAVAGQLYVCGGRYERHDPISSVERLSTDGTTWEPMEPMREARFGAALATVGGSLYVCGGASKSHLLSSVERFDTTTESPSWESLPAMTTCRGYVAAGAVAGRLHVFGGYDRVDNFRSAEQFNPATGRWFPLPSMNEGRSGAAATVLRD
eukprot:TRINITY_DN42133_c0_g1_i1.p1 TRINITY_DN42133_c0_g1~~TRINITY_DN42133_c0_g1_i1.p1  ORF type:complete len:413 (+),score=76.48 TRINITY_DN42133_c0_g1_i1:179-1417(+)